MPREILKKEYKSIFLNAVWRNIMYNINHIRLTLSIELLWQNLITSCQTVMELKKALSRSDVTVKS